MFDARVTGRLRHCRSNAVSLSLKTGGSGGFLFACEDFVGECSTIHSPPALFFFFFFKVEISSCTLIPLFRPGSVHSGLVSLDDCDRVFPDKLRVSSFPDRFARYAWTAA